MTRALRHRRRRGDGLRQDDRRERHPSTAWGRTASRSSPTTAYYRDWVDLPKDVLDRKNFDHPDSLETELLVRHLRALKAGAAVEAPIYDFKTHRRAPETRRVEPRKVILVDGILIFAEPELRKLFDVKIFVDTDADVRLIRRIRRDIAERGRTLESVVDAVRVDRPPDAPRVRRAVEALRRPHHPRRGRERGRPRVPLRAAREDPGLISASLPGR